MLNADDGIITAAMPDNPVYGDNSTTMSFDILNDKLRDVTADVIAAVYDENGVMTAVSVSRGETIPRGISSHIFSFNGKISGNVKVMIFDSLEKMIPLGQGEHFNVH